MAADNPILGISRMAGEYIHKLTTKGRVSTPEAKNRVGVVKKVFVIPDEITDVTLNGLGEPPMALGVLADPAITGLSGGLFVVKERTHTDNNENADEFELSATHYPNATEGEIAA